MFLRKTKYVFWVCLIFLCPDSKAQNQPSLSSKEIYQSVDVHYFTSMEDALKNPDAVYKLKLNNRSLAAVPEGISKFKNLVALDLSDNQIAELPAELFGLKNLIELNAGDNRLTSVPPQICSLKNLESLYLNGNTITSIGPDLYCLSNLQKLFLQNNEIMSLSPGIAGMKNLKYLYLFGNSLKKIPDEISDLSMLQVLLLQNNKLSEPLNGLEKLKYLNYYSDDNQLQDETISQGAAPTNSDKRMLERKAILDSYNQTGIYSPPSANTENAEPQNTSSERYQTPAGKKKHRTTGKFIKTYLIFQAVVAVLLIPVLFI